MSFLSFAAWAVFNVAVPLLAPIALLPLVGVRKRSRVSVKKLIRRSLQEGQLFWTVIAMCASACYEAATRLTALSKDLDTDINIAWLAIVWHGLVIVGSAVLVLFGTIDAADDEVHDAAQAAADATDRMPSIMTASLWTAGFTAISFCATHAWAS